MARLSQGLTLSTGLGKSYNFNISENYKEVFNRHLGPATLLNLSRGFNKLYTEGGLLYAPPFR